MLITSIKDTHLGINETTPHPTPNTILPVPQQQIPITDRCTTPQNPGGSLLQ